MRKYRITHEWSENGSEYCDNQIIFESCIENAHVTFYNMIQNCELERQHPAEVLDPNFVIIGDTDVWKLTEIQ